MKLYTFSFGFLFLTLSSAYSTYAAGSNAASPLIQAAPPPTQDAAEMKKQETAADSQTSSFKSASNVTPYKLFQAFYAAFTGTSSAVLFSHFTQHAINSWCEHGELPAPLTSVQFSAMDAGKRKYAEKTYAVISFNFTANPKHPKITAVITYLRKDPATNKWLGMADTNELTLVDTPNGWMIDNWDCY